jgi:PST family polysaccharide transporter
MRARSPAMTAAGGAAWSVATGVGARALGLGGTLALTYFVARDELGQVADAAVAVVLASQVSTLGVGQYYVSRPTVDRRVAWHATVAHVTLGAVALALVLLLGRSLGAWMRAPGIVRFLPGFAASAMLDRVSYMPERVLVRAMRFRTLGFCRTAGELAYTGASVALAWAGFGGMSIVLGNVARSAVRLAAVVACVPRKAWLAPAPLSATTAREMLRFGLPMSLGSGAAFASRRVDNAIVSGLFGAGVVGAYNLAYNVADVPAVQVGEQIGDVLFPSFASLGPARRRAALLRSTGLLALVTFPLAAGLGAVAPTLVRALLRPEWADVAPMLGILSALSVVRPVGWTISSYLLAQGRPRADALLEALKLAVLVGLLLTLGRRGPLWACAAVGIAFGVHALASMVVVHFADDVKVTALLARCAPALAGCVPMVAAVHGARHALALVGTSAPVSCGRAFGPPGASLAVEIAAGAAAYALSAPFVAPAPARDLLGLVRGLVARAA